MAHARARDIFSSGLSSLIGPDYSDHIGIKKRKEVAGQQGKLRKLGKSGKPEQEIEVGLIRLSSTQPSPGSASRSSPGRKYSHSSCSSSPLQDRDPNSTTLRHSLRLLRKPAPGLLAPLKLLDSLSRRRSSCSIETTTSSSSPPPSSLPLPHTANRKPNSESNTRDLESSQIPYHTISDKIVCPLIHISSNFEIPQLLFTEPSGSGSRPEIEAGPGAGLNSPQSPPKLIPRKPINKMASQVHDESDISSIISVSDRPVLSESEDSDGLLDTQKYILPNLEKAKGSAMDQRPPPPRKTNSDLSQMSDSDVFFNPYGLQRTNSIYSLSRASFTNQLSQLTSINLPEPSSLSSSIAAIPSSTAAAKVLNKAASQIRVWISKATEVLAGLDAEDDVEWAAAGGREGVGEVDSAISRFENLIDVYVSAIEQLESRNDISNLSGDELKVVVDHMERILADWKDIKINLEGVKQQVEMAMEWEMLWNKVLGEIGMEAEQLSRLVFEMEERRHKSSLLDSNNAETNQTLDISELHTIVEEKPGKSTTPKPSSSENNDDVAETTHGQDDSNLLSLVARMEPLRASLDFLPMRLASFLNKAGSIFPTSCEELNNRAKQLEDKYTKLNADAESLRKELGEDRWVTIFRKAGRQALKMCESVERSIGKLREALDEPPQHSNQANLIKKLENYEAKKEHYGPAIQQVLAIIDRGVETRLTVNGEILRLQSDMQRRWADIDSQIKTIDLTLEQMNHSKTNQLRDSISTILSEQRSVASSQGTLLDTPGSSPASSVVFIGRHDGENGVHGHGIHGDSTPLSNKSRQSSFNSSTTTRAKRYSSLPVPNLSQSARKTPLSKASASNLRASVSGVSSRLYQPPPSRSVSRAAEAPQPSKPRWNSSTNLNDSAIGHGFRSVSVTSPSYRKNAATPSLRSPRSISSNLSASTSAIPSPLGRSFHSTTLARPSSTVPPHTPANSKISNISNARTNPDAMHTPVTNKTVPYSPIDTGSQFRQVSHGSIASSETSSTTSTIRKPSISISSAGLPTPVTTPSAAATAGAEYNNEETPSRTTSRTGRRSSLLPQPTRRVITPGPAASAAREAMSGRITPVADKSVPFRPKWR